MLLDVSVVGSLFEELRWSCHVDNRWWINSWLRVWVRLEGANAFPVLLIIHSPHSQVTVISWAGEHCTRYVPGDTPNCAVVIVKCCSGNNFESISALLIDYWLQCENADVFRRHGEDVIASTWVRSESQVMNWLADTWERFRLSPLSVVFAVLEDEHLRFVVSAITSSGDHRCV